MSDPRAAFLAGDRLDDVALFLADTYVDDERLKSYGEPVEDGVVIVVDGERGRNAFAAATNTDAMGFARAAMDREGVIDESLTSGTCPDSSADGSSEPSAVSQADGSEPTAACEDGRSEPTAVSEGDDGAESAAHSVQFVFAFAEAENQDVGGIYAEGDVVHAYAQCACGTAYSDRWTIDE